MTLARTSSVSPPGLTRVTGTPSRMYWYFCSLICISVWLLMYSVMRSMASVTCWPVIQGFSDFRAWAKRPGNSTCL